MILAEPGLHYVCFLCKLDVVAKIRLLVVMNVIDPNGVMEVVAIDKVAEKILQTTAQDMARFHNLDHKLELDTVKVELETNPFPVVLSRSAGRNSDNQRRFLLGSYYDESAPTIKAKPAESTNASSSHNREAEVGLSPLKRQMSEIIITIGKKTVQPIPDNTKMK